MSTLDPKFVSTKVIIIHVITDFICNAITHMYSKGKHFKFLHILPVYNTMEHILSYFRHCTSLSNIMALLRGSQSFLFYILTQGTSKMSR